MLVWIFGAVLIIGVVGYVTMVLAQSRRERQATARYEAKMRARLARITDSDGTQ